MQERDEKRRRWPYGLVFFAAVLIVGGLVFYFFRGDSRSRGAEPPRQKPYSFSGGTFEASGVTQVPGTNGVLIVDDERRSEVLWMQLDRDGKQAGPIKPLKLDVEIEDPEGITNDGTWVYVVGSQSTKKGAEQAGLARFEFNKETQSIGQVQSVSGLKRFLLENVAELRRVESGKDKNEGLDIEGLAWDPANAQLLLGLRSPVIDGNAVVVALKLRDPRGTFSYDNFETTSIETFRVPLKGFGIRSIEYDERQKLFEIIAGATAGEDKEDFTLWEWGGPADSSRLLMISSFDRKLQPEGVTPVSIDGSNFKFVVFDTNKYMKMQ